MKAKNILMAGMAGAALLAAAGAQANDGWRHGHRGHAHYKHQHYKHHHHGHVVVRPARVYYAPRYYAPAPVYYAPAPVYYRPAAPVLYGNIPVSPDLNVGFRVRF
jgi:hypothetical protein